ncbi:larval cuticle protein LCP-30-like [Penaeus indicus]|uniref:larval cuticle protein LCP-30-like n=1 Tax=Penaeus indicus TaxID=29960 RepID=UPI00300C129F
MRTSNSRSLKLWYKCCRSSTRASVRYNSLKMKFVVLSLLVAVACADRLYDAPAARAASDEIAILRDDRVIEDDGRYNFDMETANGIVMSESGSPTGDEGAINSAGSFSYTAPDGTEVHLQYVADEGGFQPQGAHLPVAPTISDPNYVSQVVLSLLIAVACADRLYDAPAARAASDEIAILRDDRVIEDDGRYNFDMETANGIVMSESGSPTGDEGAINSAGSFSYTAPDGTDIHLQYVADENGFQPQGDHLPVAPEFPHPIPQFVLDQIAFAAEEDARNARGEVSRSYGAPLDD